MKFRPTITRFGQLPLLFLVRGLIVVIAIMASEGSLIELIQWLDRTRIATSMDSWIHISLLSGFSLFCSYFFGSIIKAFYRKPRPDPQLSTTRRQKIDASSFPSIHTANACIMMIWGIFTSMTFLSRSCGNLCLSDVDTRFMQPLLLVGCIVFWILFYIIISYSRVILRKHFRIDILGGTIFGGLIVRAVMHRSSAILTLFHYPLHYLFS